MDRERERVAKINLNEERLQKTDENVYSKKRKKESANEVV